MEEANRETQEQLPCDPQLPPSEALPNRKTETEDKGAPDSRDKRVRRIRAWVGVVLMVALTLGYFYAFYSGKILTW